MVRQLMTARSEVHPRQMKASSCLVACSRKAFSLKVVRGF